MRTSPRPRHPVSAVTLGVLKPVLRYSSSRDAYVLRLVGARAGPVLVRRPEPGRSSTQPDRR